MKANYTYRDQEVCIEQISQNADGSKVASGYDPQTLASIRVPLEWLKKIEDGAK